MLVRLQFIIAIDSVSTAVAWPCDCRNGKTTEMVLTHNPLESIGYGDEATALDDSARWLDRFPQIGQFEITTFVGDSK